MNARQKLHQAKLNEWAAAFADHKTSGLTIRQWCDQNNVSFHAFNYWKYLLKEEVVSQVLPDIAEVPVPALSASPGIRHNTNSANCLNVKQFFTRWGWGSPEITTPELTVHIAQSAGQICGANRTRCAASGQH